MEDFEPCKQWLVNKGWKFGSALYNDSLGSLINDILYFYGEKESVDYKLNKHEINNDEITDSNATKYNNVTQFDDYDIVVEDGRGWYKKKENGAPQKETIVKDGDIIVYKHVDKDGIVHNNIALIYKHCLSEYNTDFMLTAYFTESREEYSRGYRDIPDVIPAVVIKFDMFTFANDIEKKRLFELVKKNRSCDYYMNESSPLYPKFMEKYKQCSEFY